MICDSTSYDGKQKKEIVMDSFLRNTFAIQQMWRNKVQSHSHPGLIVSFSTYTFLIGKVFFSNAEGS